MASSGLKIRQNLVTLPAAAIRTSASLSLSSRTYAGTRSILEQKIKQLRVLHIDLTPTNDETMKDWNEQISK